MTCDGDVYEWLDYIAELGANGCRFFALQTWGQKEPMEPFQPYPKVGTWVHPTINKKFPKFSLSEWNEIWWNWYWDILGEMKRLGLTAHIVAHDYSSLKKDKHEKYYHPFRCSDEAFATRGGVWGEARKPYHAQFFRRLIKDARQVGVDFTFEIMNEYDAKDWPDEHMLAWHQWAVKKARGFGAKTIIASAMRNHRAIKENGNDKDIEIYSQHGIVRPEKVDDAYDKWEEEKGILISGDGGFDGDGTADAKGRQGASPNQMRGIAKKIYGYGYEGYEYFDRGLYKRNNSRANLNDFDDKALIALVDECQKLEQ